MSFSFTVLGSGSRGNATVVSDGATTILFDAGFSGKELARRMKLVGLDPKDIDAVFISHEHSDHIKGAGVISRRYDLAVHATRKVHEGKILSREKLKGECRLVPGSPVIFDAFKVTPFEVPHDASQTIAFRIENAGKRMAIATDMGHTPPGVISKLRNCDALVLESNHDVEMLKNGPYPWPLKQRILSDRGHLENAKTGEILARVVGGRTKHVTLAHLSEENNTPAVALKTVKEILKSRMIDGVMVVPASQDEPAETVHLDNGR